MDRKETTELLSNLLVRDILSNGYWASEVTFNYGRKNMFRVDFMSFKPHNQTASGIEKGVFSCYEVKSCLADYRSSHGHNFIAEKNYYVMPMSVYKQIASEIKHGIGVYCTIPHGKTNYEEFENPSELMADKTLYTLKCVKNARPRDRDISNNVMLFNMLRSGS